MFKRYLIFMPALAVAAILCAGSIGHADAAEEVKALEASIADQDKVVKEREADASRLESAYDSAISDRDSIGLTGGYKESCTYYMGFQCGRRSGSYEHPLCIAKRACTNDWNQAARRATAAQDRWASAQSLADDARRERARLSRALADAKTKMKQLPAEGNSTVVVETIVRAPERVGEIVGKTPMHFDKDLDLLYPEIIDRTAIYKIRDPENDTTCTYSLSGPYVASSSKKLKVNDSHEWFVSDQYESEGKDAWVLLKSDDLKGSSLKIEGTSQDVIKCMKDHGFNPSKVEVRKKWHEVKAQQGNAAA